MKQAKAKSKDIRKTKAKEYKMAKVVTLTDAAVKKFIEFSKKEKKVGFGLKIYVFPGGCSGFQYGMEFVQNPSKTDEIYDEKGLRLFIDKNSVPLLKGVAIDYVDNLHESGFKINNPNAKATCGCGSSFH
jgi:iron-sulfur cluster insertion protein